MTTTPYDTSLPIRPEILDTHAAAVQHWASPGTWWSAAERLAIANEVRRARDADELPPWVAPSSVEGLIDQDHPLPAPAIDVIWRVTNHLTTLSREWYDSLVPEQISAERYVELIGLVAQINLVDHFADALELQRPQLADAVAGEPTRVAPEGAAVRTHWVPTAPIVDDSWRPVEHTEDTGLDQNPDVPNVRKALSLVPAERIMQWVLIDAHYVPGGALGDDFGQGVWSLQRAQIELIGASTSALNECFY